MIDTSKITKGMEVLDSVGTHVGIVDHTESGGMKIARRESLDGQHHHVPDAWIDRVDEHVHLNRTAAEIHAGWPEAGAAAPIAATIDNRSTAAPVAAVVDESRKPNWLAWLALLAGLLALLWFLLRDDDRTQTVTTEATTAAATSALPVTVVTLPGGKVIDLSPGTLNFELQAYLASDTPAPRRFAFDKLNFESGSSTIRAEDRPTIDTLAQVLMAYPAARVRLIGFTDAVGSAATNAALGGERANAVVAALTEKGVAADQMTAATGGESDPAATNGNGDGRAENRRTEVEVTAK